VTATRLPTLDAKEQTELYLELWKQTIQVQMHFNDIEMKVRTAAITVLTFVLGATSLALKEGASSDFFGLDVPLATITLLLGCVLWGAFYFVDQWWYHRLLLGAVKHGEALETVLRDWLPEAGLTKQIGESSPKEYRILWGKKRKLHSTGKMKVFYGIILGLLGVGAVVVWNAR
jgi:hypothetical protein